MDRALAFYPGKRVAITGGLGFIGSNLARRLVALGSEVLLIDSMVPDYGGNLANVDDIRDRVRINFADIRDVYAMNYLVQGQDIIFNLAGQVSHIDSMRDPHTDLEINCRAQLSLLEACRYHNPTVKIVYASTRQVYGRPLRTPVDETHVARPTDVNGINKLAGESYHIVYNNAYGVRATVLRLTNTYGPRQLMKHNRQGFLPWFVRLVLDDEEIPIYGDGQQRRDFTYVDDVVDAFLLVGCTSHTDGEIYNLGGESATLLEVAKLLIEIAGRGRYRLVPWPPEKRVIDIGSFEADYRKLTDAVGWRPRTALADGLREMIRYYERRRQYYW
jgi:UDP-glucose 4-epimerase